MLSIFPLGSDHLHSSKNFNSVQIQILVHVSKWGFSIIKLWWLSPGWTQIVKKQEEMIQCSTTVEGQANITWTASKMVLPFYYYYYFCILLSAAQCKTKHDFWLKMLCNTLTLPVLSALQSCSSLIDHGSGITFYSIFLLIAGYGVGWLWSNGQKGLHGSSSSKSRWFRLI